MTLDAWLLFSMTEAALCLSPGPAVLLVVSYSLRRGVGEGLRASAGILAANALYFAISATGIGAVLMASWQVFFLVKWIGAAYLVWLGLRMIFECTNADDDPASSPPPDRALAHGFVTQGANPKVIFFFAALLPQFVDPAASVPLQIGILGITSVLIELAVLAGYAFLAGRSRRFVRPQFERTIGRVGGALLVGAGAGLAALRRP